MLRVGVEPTILIAISYFRVINPYPLRNTICVNRQLLSSRHLTVLFPPSSAFVSSFSNYQLDVDSYHVESCLRCCLVCLKLRRGSHLDIPMLGSWCQCRGSMYYSVVSILQTSSLLSGSPISTTST